MIYINLKKIEPKHFPDGTQMLLDLKVYPYENNKVGTDIYWKYENDEECMRLYFIVKHIKEHDPHARLILTMPYFPNARMDRVKSAKEVFTLKYFCEFINSLGFDSVRLLDPHSYVGPALLDRVEVMDDAVDDILERAIDRAFEDVEDYKDMLVYFPDAGAMKRYGENKVFKKIDKIYGQKKRNWETGKIEGLDIMNKDGQNLTIGIGMDFETGGIDGHCVSTVKTFMPFEGKTILMVDDIISYGGTMYYSAVKLKELGAKEIFAYATHTENSVLDKENGKLIKCLEDGTVTKLFTTDSIYSGKHPSIEIIG